MGNLRVSQTECPPGDWLWPAVERAQVPVVLGAAMFLPTVGKIAERHSGLKLIVDHMGVARAKRGLRERVMR